MSSGPRIIAVCGAKRAGKDTVADHLVASYGYEKVKFASALKAVVGSLFGLGCDQLEGDRKDVVDPNWGVTPRHLLQFFGTEIMQYRVQECLPGIGRRFWAEKLFRDIGPMTADRRIVVSDVRFPHEVEEIAKKSMGSFAVIRVDRGVSVEDTHPSEMEYMLIDASIVLRNAGSIEDLLASVDDAMTEICHCKVTK